ncbi:hypothetical protein [Streptomyces albipurpureus]|uniref:Uncharacterized protein n=1 Tax=Streptomyces albipurpureus TaxID=2897419 RepID=A0ABT0UTL8_9ACTN|nr:hypothetical protein [Streptomyces sp. CWNU-1]MCM2391741.1 hypothetical protein [Streptomyces sp. CWNU-1]
MALYKVSRTDTVDYDEHEAVVVRAESSKDALAFVTRIETGEGRSAISGKAFTWSDPAYRGFLADGSNAKVTRIRGRGEPGEILASFNAG